MTKFIDIICKNTLTGSVSEFGVIATSEIRDNLYIILEGKEMSDSNYTVFHFEEFVFAAYNKIEYTDNEGKRRKLFYSKQ